METKSIKLPGPNHPITIEPNPARVTVTVAGRVIADTRKALTLRETGYAAVQYIPQKDVDMTLLKRTDHRAWEHEYNHRRLHLALGGKTPAERLAELRISPATGVLRSA